jgi:hypothetical protein
MMYVQLLLLVLEWLEHQVLEEGSLRLWEKPV